MTRREIREHIFRLLFDLDFNGRDEAAEQTELYMEQIPDEDTGNTLSDASEEEKNYISAKTADIMARVPEIDALINEVSHGMNRQAGPERNGTGRAQVTRTLNGRAVADRGPRSNAWRTDRMGKAELAILRLAVYEMKFDDDIPVGVAINEAVELSKKYGREQTPRFVNGVLAALA